MDEIDQTWCEEIEGYLSGEMTAEERSAFESEMAGNEDLSALFKLYKTIETEMRAHDQYIRDEAALKKTLNELGARYSETEISHEPAAKPGFPESAEFDLSKEDYKIKKFRHWKRLAIAAGITGIIALGVTWYLQNETAKQQQVAGNKKKTDSFMNIQKVDTIHLQGNTPSPNLVETDKNKNEQAQRNTVVNFSKLFADNFRPDAAPADKEGPLEDALTYYEHKAYRDAINAIEHADLSPTRGLETDEDLTVFYAAYYKALSLMAGGSVSKAIPELKNAMIIRPDKLSYIKTQWYLALAYLKTGTVKKSKELLEQIANNDHEQKYRAKAITLLNELGSIEN